MFFNELMFMLKKKGCTNYFRYNWVFHDKTTVFVLVSSMYVVFKIKTLQHFLKSFLADKLSI